MISGGDSRLPKWHYHKYSRGLIEKKLAQWYSSMCSITHVLTELSCCACWWAGNLHQNNIALLKIFYSMWLKSIAAYSRIGSAFYPWKYTWRDGKKIRIFVNEMYFITLLISLYVSPLENFNNRNIEKVREPDGDFKVMQWKPHLMSYDVSHMINPLDIRWLNVFNFSTRRVSWAGAWLPQWLMETCPYKLPARAAR